MTILEAIRDPALFGPFFRDRESWRAWEAFLSALFGLELTKEQLAIYRRLTGRKQPPKAQAQEGWLIVGRRGGKSRIAALVAVYLACFRDYSGVLAPGERGTLPVIASDRQQARTVFRYITRCISMPHPMFDEKPLPDPATGCLSLRTWQPCGPALGVEAVRNDRGRITLARKPSPALASPP